MNIETQAIHTGHNIDSRTGAVAQPIVLSTTFERDPDGAYSRGYVYSRLNNPTREALELALCKLDRGEAAAAFASGQAAVMAVLQGLSAGDHVIASQDLYHGTTRLLTEIFDRWKLAVTLVDTTEPEQVETVFRPNTRLVFLESPSNPTLKITNIPLISDIAHRRGARCVVDNTWATPVLQRPLELGADIVVYSTTKYFGGHSDVLGGAVVAKYDDEFFSRIRLIQQIGGAVPSPFDCWLVLRGIQTMPCRIQTHSKNAAAIAAFLTKHPKIERVYYPGLPEHWGHEIALEQMSAFGGMLSFQVRGGKAEAVAVAAGLSIIQRATSLGGVESLIEHRASIEGPNTKTPENLLRFSVGLENADDLITDLTSALENI